MALPQNVFCRFEGDGLNNYEGENYNAELTLFDSYNE